MVALFYARAVVIISRDLYRSTFHDFFINSTRSRSKCKLSLTYNNPEKLQNAFFDGKSVTKSLELEKKTKGIETYCSNKNITIQ